jgi:predicted enzyme related to lactoylglutathione lyase
VAVKELQYGSYQKPQQFRAGTARLVVRPDPATPLLYSESHLYRRPINMLKDSPIIPYIPVSDIARARKFYEQKIGLTPKELYAGGVIYECGNGSWIFMYPSGGAGTSKASQAFWSVKDVEAEVAELKSRGVVFERYDIPGLKVENDIATGGGAKTAWFKDPDGNILAISQRI